MNVIKQNITITVLYKFCFLLKAEGIYAILMACVCQKFSLFFNSKPLLHDIPREFGMDLQVLGTTTQSKLLIPCQEVTLLLFFRNTAMCTLL